MLIGSECARHDGLHTSMETMIVEVLVRRPDGSVRAAAPGETGEIAITDLHNLACPMVRYLTGDLGVAHPEERCACGRGLQRIGPIEGRVTHTLRDGAGNPVSGLVFNILFAVVGELARSFQVIQRRDGSVVLNVVLMHGDALPAAAEQTIRTFAARYLPGTAFAIAILPEIPLTAAGKREIVVVER
jgi:phenylacetate-CoA ligase